VYVQPGIARFDGGGEAPTKAPSMPAVQSPSASDLPNLSKQFSNVNTSTGSANLPTAAQAASASSRAGGGYSYSGPVAPEPAKGPGITKEQIAGGAADILFGVGSFKAAVNNAKEVITGKNAEGVKVNRAKSAASAVGDAGLGALNVIGTAALLVPGAGVGIKAGTTGLNAAVKGAKVANAVAPKTSKAITTAVKAKNAAVEAATAKSAKVVSAGDLALTSAMKGAQFLGTQAKGKTASGLAAGVIALGPGAAGASAAGKATTAITQSVNAAKKVTAAADTFVPNAAKAATKVTSGGAVPDVIRPSVAAAGVKAGTSGKVAQTVTAANAIRNAAPVTNNPFYNNNPFKTDTKASTIDAKTPNTAPTESQSPTTLNNPRVNSFNDGAFKDSNKPGGTDIGKPGGTEPGKPGPTQPKPGGDVNKNKINDELPTSISAPVELPTINETPTVAPSEQGPSEGYDGPPYKKPKEPDKKKKKRLLLPLKNDSSRQWTPSSII